MSTISHEALLQQLRWRYATKTFDASRRIADADWQALEETLVLTPSSFGLQPWKFFVITNQSLKDKLVAASWNQRQLADGSHVVVFAIKRDLNETDVDRHLNRMAEVRGIEVETFAGLRKMIVGFLGQPKEKFNVNDWSARQTYIALGNFMTAAALMGIDTCPMEGIVPSQYDELLGIATQGYATVVACVAGYRTADDKYASAPKIRFPKEHVVERLA